jgi:E3 ubiquitin-protein ligase MARCH6
MIRSWCVVISWILDIRSYLLGDVPLDNQDGPEELRDPLEPAVVAAPLPEVAEVDGEGGGEDAPLLGDAPPPVPVEADLRPEPLGVAHQALLQGGAPTGFQPYNKPTFFPLRIMCLILLMCASLLVTSLVTLTLPVYIGRHLLSVWMGDGRIHELYTAACGLYTCWLATRCITLVLSWIPLGWTVILLKLKQWTLVALKTGLALVILLGVIPLLLGILFELVVIIPLRVPLNQTPVFFIWQDWALGVLHTKILCGLTMMGPNWWLKRVIEQIYQGGLRNMNLQFIILDLAVPSIMVLGMSLAVPYVIAASIVPLMGATSTTTNQVLRRIYPGILVVSGLVCLAVFQIRQFWKLYEHIKNDKYLVGKRLVNYDHRPRGMGTTPPSPAQSTAP